MSDVPKATECAGGIDPERLQHSRTNRDSLSVLGQEPDESLQPYSRQGHAREIKDQLLPAFQRKLCTSAP